MLQEPNGVMAPLHITMFSKCEVDRSTLGLFYSSNVFDWTPAGMIDYHISLGRHFAYPHMVIEGTDLLVSTSQHACLSTRLLCTFDGSSCCLMCPARLAV